MAFYLVVVLGILASAENTGIKFGISNRSINVGKTELLTRLIAETEGKKIIDSLSFSGELLSYNLTLSNAVVQEITGNVEGSQLEFGEQNHMSLNMSDFTGILTFDMNLVSDIYSDFIQAFLEMKDVDLVADLIVYTEKGHAIIQLENLDVQIEKFSFLISGPKYSVIANFLFKLLNKSIKYSLEKALATKLKEKMNEVLYDLFANTEVVRKINDKIGVNYTLTEEALVTKEIIEVNTAGEFFLYEGTDKPDLPAPPTLPTFDSTFAGVQAAVSDYMINSYYFAAFKAKMLQVSITSEEFPSLNTKDLEAYFPGIIDKFGDHKDCSFHCAVVEEAPVISIVSDGVGKAKGTFSATCDIVVNNSDTAAQIYADFEFEGEPFVDNWTIKGRLIQMVAKGLKETQNFTGKTADLEKLESFMNDFIKEQTEYFGSLVFGEGIRLPQRSNTLKDFKLKVEERYLLAGASPTFSS